ncbi:histidine kinase [Thiomicrospira aerophila AL3]|uniref:histidine kinase n=1 Tax=Thiomicrospira aerophila AL3 TaxID=717772 RepID=W0DYP8_9GAMM|nr:ATP-binding protein [Thiomicrospira aerophila]AHF02114.1 histidine kinase [Thiomicrospira aerophila AL3]
MDKQQQIRQEIQQVLEQVWLARVREEKHARLEAERLLEDRTIELYLANENLKKLTVDLERQVEQRTSELEKALEKSEQAATAKSDFLATMSHEIRTPMHGVLGLTDLLLTTELNAQQKEYLNTLKNCSQTLLAVINDILDFSKIEAGKLSLESIEYEPIALFNNLKTLFEPQITDKGLVFSMQIEKGLPNRLIGDPTRFQQILYNLLSNAIKFTHEGQITLKVSFDPSTNRLFVKVKDTGIGISQLAMKRLFKAFSQADSSITRRFGGTGLGLAICDRLVKAMGGDISVYSEVGAGSEFAFNISVQVAKELRQRDHQPTIATPQLDSLKVLVVEDNPVNQMLVKAMLAKLHIMPAVAQDGLEAVDLIRDQNFDIVLMDVQMPTMDGLRASQYIRSLGDNIKQPYIIALTANAFESDRVGALDAGMNAFLAKPLSFEALQTSLVSAQEYLS